MQEWWTASDRDDRRRHDRLRHGHRQGRRPLRLPLQPAEEPRDLLAGDRPRRPRRRAEHLRAASRAADDVPALENFAYGDTPTRDALAALLDEVLHERGRRAVRRRRVRPRLAPRRAAARAEDGAGLPRARRLAAPGDAVLRRLPASARPTARSTTSFAGFDPARADFLRRLVASGKTGRIWTTHRSRASGRRARRGAQPDRRGARATWSSRALVELKPADARQRYTLLELSRTRRTTCVDRLVERFDRREQTEIERIERVLALVTHDGCQVRRARRLLRRDARRALRPLQPLPRRGRRSSCRSASPRRRIDAVVERRRARGAAGRVPEALGAPTAARALPLRAHEPGDEPRETDPRAALRRPRRLPLRRRARVVRRLEAARLLLQLLLAALLLQRLLREPSSGSFFCLS